MSMANMWFRRALVLGLPPALCLAAGFGLGSAAGARWVEAPAVSIFLPLAEREP